MTNKKIKVPRFSYWLAVGFGCGLLPYFPGTIASFVAIVFWLPMSYLPVLLYWLFIMLAVLLGVWICGKTANVLNRSDPSCIVWDEFVGMWITLFFATKEVTWLSVCLSFLLFRFFDIVKPWPIRWFDRHLIGGLGIMADDIVAGFAAGICVFLFTFVS